MASDDTPSDEQKPLARTLNKGKDDSIQENTREIARQLQQEVHAIDAIEKLRLC